MDYDDASQQSIDKLTLNRYDRDFFRREILQTRDAQYTAPPVTVDSHRLIRRAREFLTARFAAARDEMNNPHEFNAWILRVQKILTLHISVVAIVSQDGDNAALVFETLNDRGIGLSTPDLLRNLILRRANENETEEIATLWGEVLESDNDVSLKTFLRHFWISRKGDVKAQSLYREIKDAVETENVDSLEFSRQLRDASILYRDILNAHLGDQELDHTLQDIADIGASAAYPVLLTAAELDFDKATLGRFARALLVTYVRHTVIGRLENARLETVFYGMAKSLRENGNIANAIHELKGFAPNDAAFAAAFASASLSDRTVARYILRELERKQRTTEELDVALPPKVHVEHVYPRSPRPDERWENHAAIVNRIGNLTLLSRRLNTAIKNAPFPEKRPRLEESEIHITSSLAEFADWSLQRIEQRQDQFAANAAEIWSLPE